MGKRPFQFDIALLIVVVVLLASMVLATSKLTNQGQVSVPVEVRKVLGVAPGSVIEWEEKDGAFIVRRRRLYSFDDMRDMLWAEKVPEPKTLEELNQAGALHVRAQHARGRY